MSATGLTQQSRANTDLAFFRRERTIAGPGACRHAQYDGRGRDDLASDLAPNHA